MSIHLSSLTCRITSMCLCVVCISRRQRFRKLLVHRRSTSPGETLQNTCIIWRYWTPASCVPQYLRVDHWFDVAEAFSLGTQTCLSMLKRSPGPLLRIQPCLGIERFCSFFLQKKSSSHYEQSKSKIVAIAAQKKTRVSIPVDWYLHPTELPPHP